jgi:hypothetical protein
MSPDSQAFSTSLPFKLLYSVPVLLAVLFLYDFWRSSRPDALLFLGICLVLALVTVPRGWAQVVLTEDRLTLQMPLRRLRTVRLRQLAAVERSQRLGHALILFYHPVDERGRLDIANQEILGLVPLDRQDQLESQLRQVVGREASEQG